VIAMPRQGWRADAAAAGLGIVAALALPPLHVLPALLIAVPGLLLLIDAAPGPVTAMRRGFWFGLGHHLVGLYWITEAILLESARYWWFVPIAVPSLAAILAPFIAVPCGVARLARPGLPRLAALAGAWVLAELARQFIGTGFPWNPWGSVWAIPGPVGDVMLQPLALVGTPGLTLATVLLAGLPSLGRRGWAAGAAALAAWAGVGLWRLSDPAPTPPGLDVVLVQGNVAQGQKWDRASVAAVFDRYLRLTRQGVAEAGATPSVVVWPETASAYFLGWDQAAREMIAQAMRPARGALVGTLTFSQVTPSNDPANVPFNSMVAIAPDGSITGSYDKWHLVPFGEYPPTWVPFAIQIVPGHFGFGRGPATLALPQVPSMGGLICYEAIFPGQVADGRDRPDWLVNITNDAWFGNSTGPRQHLAAARMRAVEEGLPLMRAANTGISAGFDAFGRELGRLGMGREGTLVLPLPGKRPPTSFSRWGLAIPFLLGLGLVGSAFGLRRRSHS
jgi:apolipoprotein N-acyltransferase